MLPTGTVWLLGADCNVKTKCKISVAEVEVFVGLGQRENVCFNLTDISGTHRIMPQIIIAFPQVFSKFNNY